MAVKRWPIGVWFSLAIAAFVLSFWLGSMLGSSVARYWYGHHQQEEPLEAELAELSAVQNLQLYASIAPQEGKPGAKVLLNEIAGLENLKRRLKEPEIKSVVDLELGLAYLHAATAEQQNDDKELAKKYMQSAQVVFKSLGWQDYSEEKLKSLAKQELDHWKRLHPKASEK